MVFQHIADEFRCVLRATERSLGLDGCLRGMDARWHEQYRQLRVPHRMHLHLTPFCFPQKERDNDGCKRSCHWVCGNQAREQRLPFVRRCHVDASEIIVPVHRDGGLALMLQLGQFRENNRQPAQLPLWSAAKIEQALRLCRGTQAWLSDLLDRLCKNSQTDDPIETFLDQQLARDPDLADLARHLRCSVSWAGAQVRKNCGCSWRALKQQRRLERSRRLLADSDLKISAIARQVGMEDGNYFCRWFKKTTGTTAGAWRKQHRRDPEDV